MQDKPTSYTPEEKLRYRASKISKFIYSLFVYLVVNIFLFWIDYSNDQRIDWAFWVLFGWGLGIALQGFELVVKPNLEERVYNRLKK
jgi:hypothetical protein